MNSDADNVKMKCQALHRSLKIPELKHWLQCRRAFTKGLKADLVARYVFPLKLYS